MKSYYKTVGLAVLCGLFGKSCQAYYEQLWHEEKALFEDAVIVDLVKEERRIALRVGGRNLYQVLKPELNARQVHVGSDRFFEVLKENGLLVKRRRRRAVMTMSRHGLPFWPNLAKGLAVLGAGQLWVSDITYIRVGEGSCYLILITDSYSHQVVGQNFGACMDAAFCIEALGWHWLPAARGRDWFATPTGGYNSAPSCTRTCSRGGASASA